MKFTLRDLFWLMLVVAIIGGVWIRDRLLQQQLLVQAEQHKKLVVILEREQERVLAEERERMNKRLYENFRRMNPGE